MVKKVRNNIALLFSRKFFQLVFTLILLVHTGCTLTTTLNFPDWQNQDLRYIDPIDSLNPASDLIAVETRFDKPSVLRPQQQLYLRLDFLSRSITSSDSILIFFDISPGGMDHHPLAGKTSLTWEFYLVIRSNQVQVYGQQHQTLSGIQVAVFHQIKQDYLEIAMHTVKKNFFIPADGRIQIFVIADGDQQILDRSDPISISALSIQPVNVMFVFWNTYPASTPVQALRRWDGAHTGPLGARHGLYNLLRAAQSQNIPLVLLDLKSPMSLSALDFGGKLTNILPMAARNQIILPDNLPLDYSIHHSDETNFLHPFYQQTLDTYGFSKSTFTFLKFPTITPDENKPKKYSTLFTLSKDTNSAIRSQRFGNGWLYEIPYGISAPAYQPSDDGLAIKLKKEIISELIQSNQGKPKIIAIGGDLPFSTWGDYQIARDAFETIQHLAWVHIMNAQDYSSWRFTSQPPTVKERSSATSIPFSFLPTLHSRELTLVRNLFLDSLFPLDQQNDWDTLQNNLVKLLPAYTFVDEWNQQPHQISACPTDISGDGNKDCILANPYLFLWIDPVGGGILFIYGKINGTLHQIIAPGMTLTNGQTEPSQWDFRQGIYLEKRMDSVALQDNPPYPRYEIGNDSVIFGNIPSEVNLQHNYTKLVHIENKRLEVVYQNPVNQPLIIPLNLDPWNRFEKGWSNNYKICMANGTYSSDTLCWSYQSNNPNHDIFVRITAGTSTNNGMPIMQPIKLSIETFKDTQFRFLRTEDPNQEKPIGHYLPFPMSLIRILSSNSEPLRITITISNDD